MKLAYYLWWLNVEESEMNSGAAHSNSNEGSKKESSDAEENDIPYKIYLDQAMETALAFQANHPDGLEKLGKAINSLLISFGKNEITFLTID